MYCLIRQNVRLKIKELLLIAEPRLVLPDSSTRIIGIFYLICEDKRRMLKELIVKPAEAFVNNALNYIK